MTSTPDPLYVGLDINTGEVIEFYRMVDNALCKFNAKTGEKLGFTIDSPFVHLPEAYKEALADFPYKDNIIYWADKPYGRVVGVSNKDL
jgi:hypothetical protein